MSERLSFSKTMLSVSKAVTGYIDQSRDLLTGGQRWTVSDFESKKSVIKAGLGWGGIPEHLMQQELASGKLVPLTVEGYPPRYTEIFAIRRRNQPMGQVMSQLWNELGQARQVKPEPDGN